MNQRLIALSFSALCAGPVAAAISPVYQVTNADATWTHQGDGVYTVPVSAEDYINEIWERPIQDNKWFQDATTRTSGSSDDGGEYWAWNDLATASWGIGTSDGMDYLFMSWTVVGDFKHIAGESNPISEGLKGHYYFYARPNGKQAFAVEVSDASGLDGNFSDSDNKDKVNIYDDSNGDVSGTGITVTGENGGDSYGNSQVMGVVRANGTLVEAAVKLSDLGLTLADFNTALDWAYSGVANSNPSDPNTGLFANDFYPEAIGSGQEYDTVQMGTLVPEPTSALIFGLGGIILAGRKRRR